MSISEAAVEAAAKAMFERSFTGSRRKWHAVGPAIRDDHRQDAQAALEAAAPYILAAKPATDAERYNQRGDYLDAHGRQAREAVEQ